MNCSYIKYFKFNKIRWVTCLILLLFSGINVSLSQVQENNDSLKIQEKQLPEFFVTATRTARKPEDIPSRLSQINSQTIDIQPVLSTDAVLTLIPGANLDRPQGIFSKNASITMRGLNGSPRILILVDGVPVSKTDGGGVNWNRIIPDNIDRIEVIKGPVSTVYGGNAMSGVINVITRKPKSPVDGELKLFGGTYNTFGGLFRLTGKTGSVNKGFYYGINGFYRQGDGYIIVPESSRDSLDVKTYLKEFSALAKVGYQYGQGSYTELEYSYYDDKRGDGTRIYEPDGGYNCYPTHYVRVTTNNYFGRINWILKGFYQNEHYLRQSETMSEKKGKKYTLYNTDAYRVDQGIWTNISWKVKPGLTFTGGLDLKQGSVDGKDIYITSTDILENKGKMNFLAFFGEAEWQPFSRKVSLLAGLRYDVSEFFDGSFIIQDPTTLTEFMTSYPTDFQDMTWDAWSPKAGIKYRFSKNFDLYFSYSHGFRPGMLDDMCRNGNVSKGFKLANPKLQPEKVDNFELGSTLKPFPGLLLEPSVYYTLGTDFHYFVGNGDSIATGGDNLKPIIQRQNVSQIRVIGAEITCSWKINTHFNLLANYAWNDSKIRKFDTTGRTAKDLTGKFIMEVPVNQAFSGIYFKNKILQSSLVFNFHGAQYSDDENTLQTPAYQTFDFKIGTILYNHININLVVQDIFDNRYYDSKGNISPGRFFMFNISYLFSKTLTKTNY